MERISPNILIVLFSGLMNTVTIHLPAERLHFGFHEADHTFSRPLRDPKTGAVLDEPASGAVRPFDDERAQKARYVALSTLYTKLRAASVTENADDFTHATFALEMIEGVPQVHFTID
jgi:hypothetical protein